MSRFWVVVLCLAGATGHAQWIHKKIVSQIHETPYRGSIGQYYQVNARGDAMFVALDPSVGGYSVYRNATNLSVGAGAISGLPGRMNAKGDVAWRGNGHIWVNSTKHTSGILTDGGNYDLHIAGITVDGRPFWDISRDPTTRRGEMYLGRSRFDLAPILGTQRFPTAKGVTPDGTILWQGYGNVLTNRQVFRDLTDISSAIVGPSGFGTACLINGGHQVLWMDADAGPNNRWKMYLDDVDISATVYRDPNASGHCGDLNDSGHVLWDVSLSGTTHDVFVGNRDLTAEVYGDHSRRDSDGFFLSANGRAVWVGLADYFDGNHQDVFADTRNLSRETLGPSRSLELWPRGVDNQGHVLWFGDSDRTGHMSHVFVDTFDLTTDAPGRFSDSFALAMGPSGDALWTSQDAATGKWDYWLSSPVPEPSALCGIVVAIAWLCRRRTPMG